MGTGNASNISVGPGTLYDGVLGTPYPTALASALDTGWKPVGYTNEGTEISFEISSDPVEVAEELDPVLYVTTGRNGTVTFACAENTVTNLSRAFNGGTVTQATGTAQTISNKALTSNVATLTTSAAHGFTVGQTVRVAGVDATFNGDFVVTAVPTSTTFSFARTAANVTSAAATGTAATLGDLTYTPPSPGSETRRSLLFVSDDGQEIWHFPKVFQGGAVSVARRKGADKVTLPMEFRIEKMTGQPPFRAIYSSSRA